MEFLSLEADDYESALRLAREKWGSAVRVHTRRDVPGARGSVRCRITFYLVDLSRQVRFDPEAHREHLLAANAIPAHLCASGKVWASIETMQQAEVEVRLIEQLFSSIDYTGGLDRRFHLLVGAGAREAAPNLAVYYRAKEGKKVAILSFADADPSLSEAALRLSLPLYHASGESEPEELVQTLERYERVVLLSSGDEMPSLVDERELTRILVTTAAVTERGDVDAVLVTDLDKAQSVGPLLAYLADAGVVFAYVADEQGEVRAADSAALLSRLNGFSLDLASLSFS